MTKGMPGQSENCLNISRKRNQRDLRSSQRATLRVYLRFASSRGKGVGVCIVGDVIRILFRRVVLLSCFSREMRFYIT